MQGRGSHAWRNARTVAVWSIVAFLIGGCGFQCASFIGGVIEFRREVAPFEALGARVVATGGDDFGRSAGREGVGAIYFDDNVGDAELATLAGRMERFPNLHALRLEGPRVTDAGLVHLEGLKKLSTLNLLGTRVSDEGKARSATGASRAEGSVTQQHQGSSRRWEEALLFAGMATHRVGRSTPKMERPRPPTSPTGEDLRSSGPDAPSWLCHGIDGEGLTLARRARM